MSDAAACNPPALHAGLAPAARQALAAFRQKTGTNALGRAVVTRVARDVWTADDAYRVPLADGGRSFDPAVVPASHRPSTLHARAATGGRVTITRGAGGRGTTVHLEAPLAAREAAA